MAALLHHARTEDRGHACYYAPKHQLLPLSRGGNIENLQEVQAVFGEFGYEMVLPDSLSLGEQIALMRECKVIASMHGAG